MSSSTAVQEYLQKSLNSRPLPSYAYAFSTITTAGAARLSSISAMAMAGILSAHPQALPREALGLSKSITDALYGSPPDGRCRLRGGMACGPARHAHPVRAESAGSG